MWWWVSVGAVVAFLVFCAFYAEFGAGVRGKRYDRRTDTSTNYLLLQQQASSHRNQNSGGLT